MAESVCLYSPKGMNREVDQYKVFASGEAVILTGKQQGSSRKIALVKISGFLTKTFNYYR
jgi:hypothetical protein